MDNFYKPKVIVSRCLGFNHCRFDGQTIPDKFINKLRDYVDYKTVCPEADIGLGTPRESFRLINEKGKIIFYQPTTGKEYTNEIVDYTDRFLESLDCVDGFILKGRSPSCGIKDVKVYIGKEKSTGSTKGVGIFASSVIEKYPDTAIEEEGRLTNFRIRENFLTKLFIRSRFREVNLMKDLVKFHSDNKYLLLAYNQKELNILGRIVANHDRKPFNEVKEEYEIHLGAAFARLPRYTNYINVLMHILGYFSENLSSKEKSFILSTFDKFKDEKVPLSVPINILRSYVIKYDREYLMEQSIWQPFPEELMDISNTGKTEAD